MELEEENQISDRTVRHYALTNGLPARRPSSLPWPKPIGTRGWNSLTCIDIEMAGSRSTLFADETMLQLYPVDSRKRVRRREGERYYE